MYCQHCGRKIPETDHFCPNCGEPVHSAYTCRTLHPPIMSAHDPEDIFLGSVTAVLFGLTLIGGGIYSIAELTGYTKWVIPGGLSAMLAGTSCMVKGVCQLRRLIKTKRGDEDE